MLKGRHLTSLNGIKSTALKELIPTIEFGKCFEDWKKRWCKCHGDYFNVDEWINIYFSNTTRIITAFFISATSIHTSRGFGGYRSSLCAHGRYHFGFLNPSLGLPVVLLWATACSLLTAVIVQCSRTLNLLESEEDLFAVAAAELTLALATLLIVLLHCRIDCKYDPD